MNSESEDDPYKGTPDTRLYWHPRIEFALWIADWTLVALCYAFVWQFLATSGMLQSGDLKEDAYFAIGARAGWIMAALAFLFVASIIVEMWFMIVVQRVRAEYAPPHRVVIMVILSVPFLVVLTPYLYFAEWALEDIWTNFVLIRTSHDPVPISKQNDLSLPKTLLWFGMSSVLSCALLLQLRFSLRASVSHYTTAFCHFGFWGTAKGMLIMVMMRAKAPRKEFFAQTPVVNNAIFFVIAIGIYMLIPIQGVNLFVAILLVAWSVVYSLDLITPPAWLFLGASSYESAFVFHDLRRMWLPRLGVTLLDRDNSAWSTHYLYEAQQLMKRRLYIAKFMNNPSAPRIWSLRTRDNLWQHAVLVLMDFVTVIIIDARVVREGLQKELDWLFKSERLEKTWILGVDDKDSPALYAALSGEADAEKKISLLIERIVSGHKLYKASWGDAGLQISTSDVRT